MTNFKFIAALMVFIAGAGGGYLAARLSQTRSSEKISSMANALAGGVFLGAAFLHMLPDAIENFETFLPDDSYPFFALTAAGGFLVVLFLEKVLGAGFDRAGNGEEGAIYPYILMLTLSIHSIVTGMALGLESQLVSAGAILIAILAHKTTASMALALSFNRGNAPATRARNLLWMFYTTTPIGILGGMWIGDSLQGAGEVHFEAIFDSLAAGTFLYVAIMDILSEEFEGSRGHSGRFVFTLFGFAIMATVAIWT